MPWYGCSFTMLWYHVDFKKFSLQITSFDGLIWSYCTFLTWLHHQVNYTEDINKTITIGLWRSNQNKEHKILPWENPPWGKTQPTFSLENQCSKRYIKVNWPMRLCSKSAPELVLLHWFTSEIRSWFQLPNAHHNTGLSQKISSQESWSATSCHCLWTRIVSHNLCIRFAHQITELSVFSIERYASKSHTAPQSDEPHNLRTIP